ncbi:hypothetical protein [Fodinicola feengrottensis]|uniref:Uncharacterized protein n=1 Tax=Fodinicola feengrottensis TaxID=435914 RepID=A0ABN2IKD8_9ACTN|nr:hypothetical protein [Fodinicola feengrottensis]
MKRLANLVIAIVGGVVAVVAGFGAGVVEGFLIPLRAGEMRVPIAILVAIVANAGIALWTRYVTGNKLAPVAPAISWFAAIALLGTQTSAGDLVIVGNDWVALATVFVGAVAFAVGLFIGARPDRPQIGKAEVKSAGLADRR